MQDNSKNMTVSISTGTFFRAVLIGVFILAVMKLYSIVLVLLTSIVVASFVESAVKRLKHFIKNRTVAVFIIYFLSFTIIIGLLSVFVPVFIDEMSALVMALGQYLPDSSILNNFQPSTLSGARGVVTDISSNASLGSIVASVQSLATTVSGGFFNLFGSLFGGMLNLGLITIISFYLSVTEHGIENFLRIIIPERQEEYIIDLWKRTERKIGLWIQGQMLLGIIIGMIAYLGLTILGVKYSLVLALFTACLELIPFGIFLSMIPAILSGYLSGGVSFAFMVFALYFILHQFENYLIAPLIVKKVIGVSPLVVILSVLIGAELAGIWGVILAIPSAVCLLEFLDDLEKKKVLARMN